MGIFDNDDDFNDDFMNRLEAFNNRMNNDEEFKNEIERAQKSLNDLIQILLSERNMGSPFLDIKITPLKNKEDFEIPNDEFNIDKGSDENGDWETKNWTSPDGSISFSSFSRSSSFGDTTNLPDDIAEIWNQKLRNRNTKRTNPEESSKVKLEKLQIALDRAVQQERYEKAAEIKKMMDEIRSENK